MKAVVGRAAAAVTLFLEFRFLCMERNLRNDTEQIYQRVSKSTSDWSAAEVLRRTNCLADPLWVVSLLGRLAL